MLQSCPRRSKTAQYILPYTGDENRAITTTPPPHGLANQLLVSGIQQSWQLVIGASLVFRTHQRFSRQSPITWHAVVPDLAVVIIIIIILITKTLIITANSYFDSHVRRDKWKRLRKPRRKHIIVKSISFIESNCPRTCRTCQTNLST